MTRIVILGAGFAGVYTLKNLQRLYGNRRDVELVLVNKRNYFLFTPLLHEVATGNIFPENIVEPLRNLLRRADTFYLAEVSSINTRDHIVHTTVGDITFDYLVVALGSETNYFNTPGAAAYAFELKSLEDALKIKNRIIENLERATVTTDRYELEKLLHFVIIGGGPTGVELAGEMADFIYRSFARYYPPELISKCQITILQRGAELLPQFSPRLRQKALWAMQQKRVKVMFNAEVVGVSADCVTLADKTCLNANMVVWSAGVAPRALSFDIDIEKAADSRIMVNEFGQLKGHTDIFLLGDLASFADPTTGKPLPATGQVATKQARNVASNIYRLTRGQAVRAFRYQHSGSLVSLGEGRAMGDVFGLPLFGRLTWGLWRGVYLSKLISRSKQCQVLLDWVLGLFLPRDIADYYEGASTKK